MGKLAGHRFVAVYNRHRFQAGLGEGLKPCRHDQIAAKEKLRAASRDADGVQVVWVLGNAHMAPHSAALLGQARLIQHAEVH